MIVTPTFLYAPMNFAAASLFAHWKNHHVLKFAASVQLIGCWIRVFSFFGQEWFWLVALGTIIFFIANPLVLGSISVISNLWFSDDERAKATAIAGLMAPLGSLIGLALTGVFAT